MSADVVGLIYAYGLPLVFFTAYASCLGVPVPASLIFMVAGGFAATSDFDVTQVWLAGFIGAVSGDQSGYLLARFASSKISEHFQKGGQNGGMWQAGMEKARDFSKKWGSLSIFFSRWLFSPLGPWVNFTNGLTAYCWPKFTLWAVLGEAIWVTLYLGVGYFFTTEVQEFADLLSNTVWVLLAVGLTVWLGIKIWRQSKQNQTE